MKKLKSARNRNLKITPALEGPYCSSNRPTIAGKLREADKQVRQSRERSVFAERPGLTSVKRMPRSEATAGSLRKKRSAGGLCWLGPPLVISVTLI